MVVECARQVAVYPRGAGLYPAVWVGPPPRQGGRVSRLKSSDVLTQGPITPDWLVPDILCKGSMIVLAGDAGVGKSMLSYSLALALATGSRFLDRQLVADKVLYFDQENSLADSNAYHRRVWVGMGKPSLDLLDANLCLLHFSVNGNPHAGMMKAAVEWKPALIIIDTANSTLGIDDENDNAKATQAIKVLRAIREATGRPECAMLILKHARVTHDKQGHEHRDIRGAKTWKGELDGLIIHTAGRGRPPGDNRYRNTFLWPAKSRAFGLLHSIEIVPIVTSDGVRFSAKIPG